MDTNQVFNGFWESEPLGRGWGAGGVLSSRTIIKYFYILLIPDNIF